jgi:hypothetical protein
MARYRAVCTGNALDESKEKKTPYVKLSFLTLYDYEETDKPINKQMYATLWLSDNAISRTLDTLSKVFGWRGEDIEELNTKGELLGGIEADLVTGWETYSGKSREKIQFVNYPGAASTTRMEDASATTISKSLKGKVLAHRQVEKSATKAFPAPVKRGAEKSPVVKPPVAQSASAAESYSSACNDDLPF